MILSATFPKPVAFPQTSSNIKSTLFGFKPLIGREFDDPMIQTNVKAMFNDIEKQDDGAIGFKVRMLSFMSNKNNLLQFI